MRRAVVLAANLEAGAGALGYALYRFGAPALALLANRPRGLVLLAFAAAVAGAFLGYAFCWRLLLAGLGTPPSLRALTAYRAAGQSFSALVHSFPADGSAGSRCGRGWWRATEQAVR